MLVDIGWAVEGTMLATVMLIGIAGQLGATMAADGAGCPGEAGDPGLPVAIIATVFGGGTYLMNASVRTLMGRRRQARDP